MVLSCVRKNYVIRGSKQAEMFVKAIEESEKAVQNMHPSNVSVEHVTDPKEVKDFMKRWMKLYGNKEAKENGDI